MSGGIEIFKKNIKNNRIWFIFVSVFFSFSPFNVYITVLNVLLPQKLKSLDRKFVY